MRRAVSLPEAAHEGATGQEGKITVVYNTTAIGRSGRGSRRPDSGCEHSANNGKSQEDLAFEANVDQSTLSELERIGPRT